MQKFSNTSQTHIFHTIQTNHQLKANKAIPIWLLFTANKGTQFHVIAWQTLGYLNDASVFLKSTFLKCSTFLWWRSLGGHLQSPLWYSVTEDCLLEQTWRVECWSTKPVCIHFYPGRISWGTLQLLWSYLWSLENPSVVDGVNWSMSESEQEFLQASLLQRDHHS